ncbi:universal stress protein [Nocardia xishanensis]|uniref:Universal stress protein n=1 Tax=Nocardia xishanensis TaxID=238964 RepID=A0ABW7WVK6_9NOCA
MSPKTNPPVVAGVDGSEHSLIAVRWAAVYAAHHRAPLHLVHAIGIPVDYGPGLAGPVVDYEAFRQAGAEIVAAAAQVASAAAASTGAIEVSTAVVNSAPVPALRYRSESARLIVVGSRGLGAFRRTLLGSVSTALVRHADSPVAVIPEAAEPISQGPLVVGVDGSPCSVDAVDMAFEEASLRGVGLVAVHAWSEFDRYESRADMQAEAEALLSENLAGYHDKYPDVHVERVVAEDRPARLLLRAAEAAQLLIVGSHGRGGFAGMTLGSVGQAVLHGAECPLIVVRPDTGR